MTTANEPSVAELVEWLKSYGANARGHGSDCVRHAAAALTRLERRCAEMGKLRLPAEMAYSEMGVAVGEIMTQPNFTPALERRAKRLAASADQLRAVLDALPPERANEGKER